MRRHPRVASRLGFTMLEALIAVALLGLVLGILGTVTGQWLRSWRAGFTRLQRVDLLSLGLDRIAADLGAAQYISISGVNAHPFFQGSPSSVTFVRSAIGPNTPEGIEFVRLAEEPTPRGVTFARTHAPFRLFDQPSPEPSALALADEVVLVRPPFRVALTYAGHDGTWHETWIDRGDLPSSVRIRVTSSEAGATVAASTVALVHVGAPAACARASSAYSCLDEIARTGETKAQPDAESGTPAVPPPPPPAGTGLFNR